MTGDELVPVRRALPVRAVRPRTLVRVRLRGCALLVGLAVMALGLSLLAVAAAFAAFAVMR